MCGIVGIAGHFSKEQLSNAVHAMNAAIVHRGPDDQGAWIGDHFAFGMRRLSIIDLSGGRQPMWDHETGTGIVYNGEIYNYKNLRASMSKSGAQFQTNSDTEVVLKTLAASGPKAVNDWNGMFAVAQWNDREKKLLLIRDRVGIKPLYYFWNGSVLLFASEIKAILAPGIFEQQLNTQSVWDYLTFRYVPGPETMWRNVWKLPPAHMLEWSPGKDPHVFRYWKSDVLSDSGDADLDKKTEEFEQLFLDSVEKRLLAADVPVGVMLSGGLDSSAVAAAAVEVGHKRFHTFSVAFSEGGDYSELDYARQVAKHLDVEHHEVVVDSSQFLEMLPQVIRASDEPLADLTTVPLLSVCRLARQHVKVVLSGEGADELFAGYDFEVMHQQFEKIRRIQSLPPTVHRSVSKLLALFSEKHASRFSRAWSIPLHSWNRAHKNHMTWAWEQHSKEQFWPSFIGRDSEYILDRMYAGAASENPVDQLLAVYQQSWLVEDLLMKADKMSMAASLELRVPFLDYRIVEWANRQALNVKIGVLGGRRVTKNVLRRFARKRLPAEIISRPKKGFPVPVYQWFREEAFIRWSRERLTSADSKIKGLFPSNGVDNLVQSARDNLQDAQKTWLLIILEIWLREFYRPSALEPCDASMFSPTL